MNNMSYEGHDLTVQRQVSNRDNNDNFYDTLDHGQHENTNRREMKDQKMQEKPRHFIILFIALIVLMSLMLTTLVALLGMEGYSIKNYSHNMCESMEDVERLLQIMNQYVSNQGNESDAHQKLIGITNKSVMKLINITNSLTDHANTSTSIATVVDDILLVVKELLSSTQDSLPMSCEEVKQRQHNSPSGIYLIESSNGTIYSTYCNMSYMWTRLAYLNMSNVLQSCPSGFRLYQSGGVRACGRPVTDDGSCASVQFPFNGIRYSQIRGRVVGYQYGSTDGLRALEKHHYSINNSYVDGVSITRGSSRQHVWTFASGSSDTDMESDDICPCSSGSLPVQSFIGSHYFCESGNHEASGDVKNILYTSDPLWDGKDCGSNEGQCCSAPGLPWFHRDYGNNTTTDYIELRICCSQGTDNEDITVQYYEIYIK